MKILNWRKTRKKARKARPRDKGVDRVRMPPKRPGRFEWGKSYWGGMMSLLRRFERFTQSDSIWVRMFKISTMVFQCMLIAVNILEWFMESNTCWGWTTVEICYRRRISVVPCFGRRCFSGRPAYITLLAMNSMFMALRWILARPRRSSAV